ncbi:DUF1501 domain-containing protein [Acanthopleuribacter pedis]|uniref:DUF1501 domain-containing protein n=1 Tax=Acanthopleuribacter pedis TaxID=442870 RepID=A0A8J7Q0T9_9BACT|nr:DUF1501 domain-containing protein [Acanthopleuribacter pedis]MBO1317145.1 DUF1501 domain-containing protein [Acanthopleuribacter pedis]
MQRRNFLKCLSGGGLGLAGLAMAGRLQTKTPPASRKNTVTPRGSAENLIMVFLQGGPSHVDTFDLKTGSWTPSDFGAGTFGNLFLPAGLFPNLSQQTDKFSLLRCLSHNEAVHARASYLTETAHTFNPVFSKEQPHIGSLIGYELAGSRRESDILPPFVAVNSLVQGPGMLPSTYAAFGYSAEIGVPGLEHPDGEALFRQRYESLMRTDGANRTAAASGHAINDYHNFYQLGEGMMYQADVEDAFTMSEAELARYGENNLGIGCGVAVKLLAKDRGTRVVNITSNGWDSHYDIYTGGQGQASIYDLCNPLDQALAAMFEDLAATPGKRGGSLLDETMVVVTGEFGRTPGALTRNAGRDHYPYAYAALVAGGGIVPNQAFGATDSEGWYVTDRFWSQNRDISIHDLIATIYSSMGIDWTKEITDTPSGRAFEYLPKVDGDAAYYKDIVEMFG